MEPLAWIEVRDARDRVVERVRIDRLPATIGRDYSNDVVVEDRLVCARHARVDRDADGRWTITDLGSVNGVALDGDRGKIGSAALAAGARVCVGRSVLRLLDATVAVEPTVRDGARVASRPQLLGWLVIAGCAAITLLSAFQSSYERTALVDSVRGVIVLFAMLLVWAALWSAASRLVTHRWRFFDHLVVACAILALSFVIDLIAEYASFVLSIDGAMRVVAWGLAGLILGLVLNGHVKLVSSMDGRRRRAYAALGAATVTGGLAFLLHWDDGSFDAEAPINGVLKPLPARWARSESLDAFVDGIGGLEAQVEKLAARDRSSAR